MLGAVLILGYTPFGHASSLQNDDPKKTYIALDTRIKESEGADRVQAVRELYEFNQELTGLFDRDEATLLQCIILFQSAWRLESLQTRGEGLPEIRVLDLLEKGRQAAARARLLIEEGSDKDRRVWQNWMRKSEAEFLNMYSTHLRDAQRFDEAMDLLDASEALGCEPVFSMTFLWRATVERMRGNFEKSLEYCQEAKRFSDRIEPGEDLAGFNLDFAFERYRYFTDIGVPEQASWWLDKGQEIARQCSQDNAREWAALHQVSFLNALDRFAEAIEFAERKLGEKWLSPAGADRLRFNHAVAEVELTRREDLSKKERQAYLSDARTTLEALLEKKSLTGRDDYLAALTLARMELDAGNSDAAARWLAHANEKQAVSRSGQSVTGGSARSYVLTSLEARLLLDTDAAPSLLREKLIDFRREYLALIDQLSSMPVRKGGVGFLYYDDRRRVVAELIRLHLEVAGRQAGAAPALEDLLPAQNLGSLAKAMGAKPVGLQEIQDRLLEPDRGILSYLPAPDRSYLFLIEKNKVSVEELASEFDLDRARSRFIQLLMDPKGDQDHLDRLNEAGTELAELLLPLTIRKPLASWKGITLVGLDLLGWIPFECLPLTPGTTIGQEKAISWLPSLGVGVQLMKGVAEPAAAGSSMGAEVLMLVAPENDGSQDQLDRLLTPILLSPDRMEALQTSVGPRKLEFLARKQATEERIMARSMEGIQVLCLYAHGALRKPEAQGQGQEILERPATLVLSPSEGFDGLVGSEEVEGIHSPPVVVLAACGAAAGMRRFGDDGINHLGGAFFLAGAHTVLLTRAKLDVDSTAALTARFMENLVQYGLAPDEALQEARSKVAASLEWRHPYFHSLLQVHGIGHRPVFQATKEPGRPLSGRPGLYCLVGGLLVAGLGVTLILRRRSGKKV
ncbi:MAG: CHAT domain-containing protein [Planctomycetota bacterium]